MKQSFAPRSDAGRVFWLNNFSGKLAKYAAKYSINADEVKDMIASALYFIFWIDYLNKVFDYSKRVTAYKNQVRGGIPAGTVIAIEPGACDPGDVPPVVQPDIFGRAFSLAQRIKKHSAYTTADGEDLGIEGSVIESLNINDTRPVIRVLPGQGGQPRIEWAKGRMDGVDIYVDRTGSGVWTFLATDNFPDYVDMAPLPEPGKSAYWQYRCIYRLDDQQVGQWSDVAAIAVKG